MSKTQRPFTKLDNCIFEFLPSITPSTLKVYVALSRRINHKRKNDKVWPDWEQIRKDTGIGSDTTIQRSIEKLEELGLIEVDRTGKNNSYTLLYPEIKSADDDNDDWDRIDDD